MTLLPCPKCKSDKLLIGGNYNNISFVKKIICNNCKFELQTNALSDEAEEKWNKLNR